MVVEGVIFTAHTLVSVMSVKTPITSTWKTTESEDVTMEVDL
jgi:hypothetical protein